MSSGKGGGADQGASWMALLLLLLLLLLLDMATEVDGRGCGGWNGRGLSMNTTAAGGAFSVEGRRPGGGGACGDAAALRLTRS